MVWDGGVVAGRLGREALGADPAATVESVMERAPQTVRASLGLDDLRQSLADDASGVLVTGSDGQLLGIVRREDLG